MNKRFLKYLKGAVILAVDALIVAASMVFAYLLTASEYVYDPSFIVWILAEIGVTVIAFTLTGMYSVVYSSVGITEAIKLTAAVLSVGALNMIVWSVRLVRYGGTRVATVIAFTAFLLYFAGLSRFYKRLLGVGKYYIAGRSKPKKKVLVIGAGEAGLAVIKEMRTSDKIALDPVCILDDDPEKAGKYVYGVKVIGGTDQVKSVCDKYAIEEIFVAMPSVDKKTLGKILSRCSETNRTVRSIPGTYQILNDKVSVSSFKNVEIQDLLGREQVTVDMDEIMGYIENKVVLVTGGGGSIGSELCRQIATHRPRQLIILDIYENNAYDIEQELKRKYPALNLLTLIASVRDKGKMKDVFEKYRPQIVFHAAAHKHVPLMETSPNEAVKNNVFGTLNTARLADEYKAETFVLISTDKAV
ncbi:MAG: polysaccharide biosynthesis protein, partial [Clostridia bacterium]|nr:polysaccharide biosynthesis protein [Clostridia bacterium]